MQLSLRHVMHQQSPINTTIQENGGTLSLNADRDGSKTEKDALMKRSDLAEREQEVSQVTGGLCIVAQ